MAVAPTLNAGMRSPGDPHDVMFRRILPAVTVTAIFAMMALRMRSVTRGGAVAGSLISITIYVCTGAAGFAALGTVFLLTLIATRIGSARKQQLGMAQDRHGRRASQILANLIVATACSAMAVAWGRPWLLVCMVAALAEAAADTVASECGEASSNRVYLVTSFERVAVGTDGGISAVGTLAGTSAAAIVVWVCCSLRLIPGHGAVLAAGAAVIATFFDSLLGATLQRRGWLSNSAVNLVSTLAAAGIAAALA